MPEWTDIDGALAWLEDHINLEAMVAGTRAAEPTLDRITKVLGTMGSPQLNYPLLHITGTNGKGSVARMLTALLVAKGLSVGTYTSPDLERINERMSWNFDPITDAMLWEELEAVAFLEETLQWQLTRFEILTAAAYRWFANIAVDAAVVEVGLGGRWDATNVADATVAVVTNVSLDHVDLLGPELTDIAAEKAGIVKPGSTLILGETAADLVPIFEEAGAREVWRRGQEFDVEGNDVAHGGRLLTLRTPGAHYEEVFLPLHGRHQAHNAACALAAAEAFFDAPLSPEVVSEAFASVRVPGRMEVLGRSPLLILDGAHNPAGARAAAMTLDEEFGAAAPRTLVVGLLRGRDPAEMLLALGVRAASLVIAVPPPSPRAVPAEDVAAAARELGVTAEVANTAAEAVSRALAVTEEAGLVLVAGSLYLVGAARAAIGRGVG